MQDLAKKLRDALKKKHTITFCANCKIRYSGRAESFLDAGDRLIIIKQDGSMFVHQPNGLNPVNYMKENSSHSVFLEDGLLKIHSSNIPKKEFMYVAVLKPHFFFSHRLNDSEKIVLSGNEKDMSQMIYDNPHLISKDFRPFSLEEHTKYGFIDVFGFDKDNNVVVVECKRYTADFKAVSQLRRYVEKVKKAKGIKNVRGVLAAPSITPNARGMLQDLGFVFKKVRPPKYLEEIDKSQKKIFEY